MREITRGDISEDEWMHIWRTQQYTTSSGTWREYRI